MTIRGDLSIHKRAVHEGVKYPCGQCDYEATLKSNLDQHKRGVYEGIKYSCILCSYQASWRKGVQNHMKKYHIKQKFLVLKVKDSHLEIVYSSKLN